MRISDWSSDVCSSDLTLPQELEPPPPLPALPPPATQAVDVALENNPDILAAKATERAAFYTVRTSKADRLPTVSGTVGASYDNYLNPLDDAVGLPGAHVATVQIGRASRRAGVCLSV